jgi:hypothetical protein
MATDSKVAVPVLGFESANVPFGVRSGHRPMTASGCPIVSSTKCCLGCWLPPTRELLNAPLLIRQVKYQTGRCSVGIDLSIRSYDAPLCGGDLFAHMYDFAFGAYQRYRIGQRP